MNGNGYNDYDDEYDRAEEIADGLDIYRQRRAMNSTLAGAVFTTAVEFAEVNAQAKINRMESDDFYDGRDKESLYHRVNGVESIDFGFRHGLKVLAHTTQTFFLSWTARILFAIMLITQVGLVALVWYAITDNPRFFGEGAGVPTAAVVSAIVAVFFYTSISPILTDFSYRGIWRLVGGRPEAKIERVLLYVASVIPLLMSVPILRGAPNESKPVMIAVLLALFVFPLVVRSFGSRKIRQHIDYANNESEEWYCTDLLKRKVIGTPGASLGTSDFSSSQVSAGVEGERRTAKVLDNFVRTRDNAMVFHSVRWNTNGAPYDIDHVLVIEDKMVFIDSKRWASGNYTLLASGDTVLKDGQQIPNGELHIRAGVDTYTQPFGVVGETVLVAVWTQGSVRNENYSGTNLVLGEELEERLKVIESGIRRRTDGYVNLPNSNLLRALENNTA